MQSSNEITDINDDGWVAGDCDPDCNCEFCYLFYFDEIEDREKEARLLEDPDNNLNY